MNLFCRGLYPFHELNRMSGAVLPSGTLLRSRYLIVRRIGAGTYGNVYESTDVVDGVPVAIKLISTAGRQRASAVAELRLLRAVAATNVVRLLDAFVLPDREEAALVLELAQRDLGALLRDPAEVIDDNRCKRIFRQILSGLAAIHAAGFCVRDLKPSNCLLLPTARGEGDRAVVADFGLAAEWTPLLFPRPVIVASGPRSSHLCDVCNKGGLAGVEASLRQDGAAQLDVGGRAGRCQSCGRSSTGSGPSHPLSLPRGRQVTITAMPHHVPRLRGDLATLWYRAPELLLGGGTDAPQPAPLPLTSTHAGDHAAGSAPLRASSMLPAPVDGVLGSMSAHDGAHKAVGGEAKGRPGEPAADVPQKATTSVFAAPSTTIALPIIAAGSSVGSIPAPISMAAAASSQSQTQTVPVWHGVALHPAMDMWAAGCVLAELLTRMPLFAGFESQQAHAQAHAQAQAHAHAAAEPAVPVGQKRPRPRAGSDSDASLAAGPAPAVHGSTAVSRAGSNSTVGAGAASESSAAAAAAAPAGSKPSLAAAAAGGAGGAAAATAAPSFQRDQCRAVFAVLGLPDERSMPGVSCLPHYSMVQAWQGQAQGQHPAGLSLPLGAGGPTAAGTTTGDGHSAGSVFVSASSAVPSVPSATSGTGSASAAPSAALVPAATAAPVPVAPAAPGSSPFPSRPMLREHMARLQALAKANLTTARAALLRRSQPAMAPAAAAAAQGQVDRDSSAAAAGGERDRSTDKRSSGPGMGLGVGSGTGLSAAATASAALARLREAASAAASAATAAGAAAVAGAAAAPSASSGSRAASASSGTSAGSGGGATPAYSSAASTAGGSTAAGSGVPSVAQTPLYQLVVAAGAGSSTGTAMSTVERLQAQGAAAGGKSPLYTHNAAGSATGAVTAHLGTVSGKSPLYHAGTGGVGVGSHGSVGPVGKSPLYYGGVAMPIAAVAGKSPLYSGAAAAANAGKSPHYYGAGAGTGAAAHAGKSPHYYGAAALTPAGSGTNTGTAALAVGHGAASAGSAASGHVAPSPGPHLAPLVFPSITPEALDLLSRLLAYDPSERPTAAEALAHPYLAGRE